MIVVHQNRAFSTSFEQDKQSDLEEEEVHVPYEILSESEEEGDVTDSEKDDECDEDCESFYPSDLMSFAWQIARGMVSGSLRKKANFSPLHHWFAREMTSEKRVQKFQTDDASLPRSGYM